MRWRASFDVFAFGVDGQRSVGSRGSWLCADPALMSSGFAGASILSGLRLRRSFTRGLAEGYHERFFGPMALRGGSGRWLSEGLDHGSPRLARVALWMSSWAGRLLLTGRIRGPGAGAHARVASDDERVDADDACLSSRDSKSYLIFAHPNHAHVGRVDL